MTLLLREAVRLAEANLAIAIEGFPFSGSKLKSSGDTQIGIESVFAECGFTALRRPSDNRVVMRHELRNF